MNDDKSVFVQPQVVNNVKEKTTSMPNKQLSSLRASSPGAPRVTGLGKGRGEGELSLSFPFFSPPERPGELTDFVARKLTVIRTMERVLNRVYQALLIEFYKSGKF